PCPNRRGIGRCPRSRRWSATSRCCCRLASPPRRCRRCWPARRDRCSPGSTCSTNTGVPACRPGTAASRGTAPSGTRAARCANVRWTSYSRERCRRWRTSLAYDGERVDGRMLEQLETVLRHVADELAGWRARALKAESELKESGIRGAGTGATGVAGVAPKPDPEMRNRVADLDQENKTLQIG